MTGTNRPHGQSFADGITDRIQSFLFVAGMDSESRGRCLVPTQLIHGFWVSEGIGGVKKLLIGFTGAAGVIVISCSWY